MIRWNETKIVSGSLTPGSKYGTSTKLNKKGDLIAIGATDEFSIYGTGGVVFVYSGSNSNWTLKKVASGFSGPSFENDQARFGQSVDFNENNNVLTIGAPGTYNPSNTLRNGTVFIYTGDNFDLCSTLTGSRILPVNDSSFFGQSLSLNANGNILAVGASAQGTNKGYAYIFTGDQGIYKETQFLSGDQVSAADNFGYSVDLNDGGNILAVGASRENNFSGAVYIYTGDSSSNWTRIAKLTGTANNGEYFGASVAFNSAGNVLAIGAPLSNINDQPCGAVYTYTGNNSSNWIQTARITGDRYSPFPVNNQFGYSVNLNDSGNILIIGSRGESVNTADTHGIVYTFTGYSNNWYQTFRITGSDLDPGVADQDQFGTSVSLNGSGDILAVGAPFSDNNGIAYGAVYVFSGFTPYSQTITFSAIPTKTFGDSPFFLDATATSNLPVTFSGNNPNVATIVGSNVTIVGAGACEITAYQTGNFDYSAATPVARTLTVLRGSQTINLPSFYTGIYNETKAYDASTPQGLPLIYTGNTNVFSISANNITFINTGITILTGYNTGNLNYTGITGTQEITVNRANAIIDFPYIPVINKNITTGYTLNVTSNHSESAIQYTSSNSGSIVITGGNVLAITGIGTGTISGYQPATSHYNTGFAKINFEVVSVRVPQIISVSNLPNNIFYSTGSKYIQGYLQDEGTYHLKVHILEDNILCEKTIVLNVIDTGINYLYKVNYPINIGFIKYNALQRLGL